MAPELEIKVKKIIILINLSFGEKCILMYGSLYRITLKSLIEAPSASDGCNGVPQGSGMILTML